MSTLTTNYGWRKPSGGDTADGPAWIGALADDADAGLLVQLTKLPKGIVAWGNRTSNSTTTTTEIGVLRIDNIPIISGRAYRIWSSPMQVYSNVANDVVRAQVRGNTGGVATTGSGQIGNSVSNVQTATGTSFPDSRVLTEIYNSVVTGSLSVLLTVARTTGTGNAQILAGMDLVVEDIGLSQGDTGVDI